MPMVKDTSKRKTPTHNVSEKVKEIKERQNNWMKQRDQAKGISQDKIYNSDKTQLHDVDEQIPKINPKFLQTDDEKSNIKNKFKTWLDKRSASNSPADLNHNLEQYDYESTDSKCADTSQNSDDSIERLQKKLLSTKDFDAKANSIVDKVRRDLNIQPDVLSAMQTVTKSKSCVNVIDTDIRTPEKNETRLTSHRCPVCCLSMTSPTHTPMLLIPCGHSVCQACSNQLSVCSVCNCQIHNVTCNIMLQQIIQEYSNNEPYHTSPSNRRKPQSAYSAHRYDNTSHHKKVLESNKKKYQDQLDNLQTRIEILQEEEVTIQEEMADLDNKMASEEKQISKIERRKDDVKNDILELERKLDMLSEHQQEYQMKCEHLQNDKDQLVGKADMLQDTMSSLTYDIQKVRSLLEAEDS